MKTAQIPPVRVEPSVREEIESVLLEGETLSQFVEASVLQAARQRRAQQAFLARGRASLAQAKAGAPVFAPADVLGELQARLDARMAVHRAAAQPKKRR